MAKRIRRNETINIAPDIIGFYRDYEPAAYDQRTEMDLDPRNIEHKILIYERQVNGWFLEKAKGLLRTKDGGFIILMICLAYFEGVTQYRLGRSVRGQSSSDFKAGFLNVFPNTEVLNIDALYSKGRCGLFHVGMVYGDIVISSNYNVAIQFMPNNDIRINPRLLLLEICRDFNSYIDQLHSNLNVELRRNFDQMFTVTD